jgi:RNA polymerase sigma-70 factor (ECF subfamily)
LSAADISIEARIGRAEAAEGSPAGFKELLVRHGGMIARIAATYEADRELARDLVQEILLAVWKALPKFRGDASQRTFVARIAHNRAISHVGRAVRAPDAVELDESLPAETLQPDAEAIADDMRGRLLDAVRKLPLALRQPTTLTLEGFDAAEIADTLGITSNAVSIRLMRARQQLQELLRETA